MDECSCGDSHPMDSMILYSLGMVCGRCNQHTGNNNQGHYWAFCKATGLIREFHFCCPDNCELEVSNG